MKKWTSQNAKKRVLNASTGSCALDFVSAEYFESLEHNVSLWLERIRIEKEKFYYMKQRSVV
jgi:hypothetical protein